MKVLVNGEVVGFSAVDVNVSLYLIAREFSLRSNSKEREYSTGDKVEIYDSSNILRVSGVIEVAIQEAPNEWEYFGRNLSRHIVDGYIQETKEFTKGKSFDEFIRRVLGEYGISIKGKINLPNDVILEVFAGEKLRDIFENKLRNYGILLGCDAIGNLNVLEDPIKDDKIISRDKVIISAKLEENAQVLYDKYVVLSQGEYVLGEPIRDVKGEVGSGVRTKVLKVKNLDEFGCKKVAEVLRKKDIIRSFDYSIVVESGEDIEINTLYYVDDPITGVQEELKVNRLTYHISLEEEKVSVGFCRV